MVNKNNKSSQTNSELVQDLRSFTVQVREIGNDVIIGTGIAVATDTQGGIGILTCAHVLEDMGIGLHSNIPVSIYFPAKRPNERGLSLIARPKLFFADYDDDILLLELLDGNAPILREKLPILGTADLSEGNEFISYGYAPLGEQIAKRVEGKILGSVEIDPSGNKKLQAYPVQLKTTDVRSGLSGSAVLDTKRNLVIGLISKRWNPGYSLPTEDGQSADTAWAIDGYLYTLPPFSLLNQRESAPKAQYIVPNIFVKHVSKVDLLDSKNYLDHATLPLDDWFNRENELNMLYSVLEKVEINVFGLIGELGYPNKKSRIRHWVNLLISDSSKPQPESIIWWNFYKNISFNQFVDTVLALFSTSDLMQLLETTESKLHLLIGIIRSKRFLFILEGLELIQEHKIDGYGTLHDDYWRKFIELFAATGHQSLCIITSYITVTDLISFITYSQMEIRPLENAIVSLYDKNQQIVGCGVLIDKDTVITCDYVIREALKTSKNPEPISSESFIYLSLPFVDKKKILKAQIRLFDEDSNLAILSLDTSELKLAYPMELVAGSHYTKHEVKAFGFPSGFEKSGAWVSAIIVGRTPTNTLQLQGTSHLGFFFEPGFGGTPIWNEKLGGCVGILLLVAQGVERVAFAISIETIMDVFPEIKPKVRFIQQPSV